MKTRTAVIILIVAVCTGQSLAYYDEVEQVTRSCSNIVYEIDNQGVCNGK